MGAEPRTFEARCSFCRKSNADVDVLIGGVGVFICNECVSVANDVLAKTPPSQRQARAVLRPLGFLRRRLGLAELIGFAHLWSGRPNRPAI